MMLMTINCFCGMVYQKKMFSLISTDTLLKFLIIANLWDAASMQNLNLRWVSLQALLNEVVQ